MGNSPFDPNKRKKQKPEHNGEFNEQHGKHPQTLNELLDKETKSACATANTNENKTEQTFETDPYSALDNAPKDEHKLETYTPSPEEIAARKQFEEFRKKLRGEDN